MKSIVISVAVAAIAGLPGMAFALDPVASLRSALNVTEGGGASYTFDVRYADDGMINDGSIDNDDVRVTGPSGFDAPSALVSKILIDLEGRQYQATYRIVPPGGSWDSADNGTYTLVMQPNQVFDGLNNAVHPGSLGTFSVAISGPPIPPVAAQPRAISTRSRVLTGDKVMIGGFIVSGNTPKRVIVRAIGPSLAAFGLTGLLADPFITLFGPGGPIASNDNWKDAQQSAIQATNLAPSDDRESAIIATLPPGAYTAIMQGAGQSTGIGLVQVYDLDSAADPKLSSLSTRGFVDTGDNIMIGGFSLGGGTGAAKIGVRGMGPTLTQYNVPDVLADPVLDLRNSNGDLVRSNNDWRDTQQAEVQSNNLAPSSETEAVIIATLPPGDYTALVKGNNGTTGVALVEIYHLP